LGIRRTPLHYDIMSIATALYITGVFSVVLGILHFFFPLLFDFENAMPREGANLKPFKLLFVNYATTRQDVRGIAWVMNHFVSYNLVAYGVFDLLWPLWIASPFAVPLCLWMAGGWFVRAGSQLYLGQRAGDWLILAGFALIGLVHVVIAITLI
jgi:hypothetical protein